MINNNNSPFSLWKKRGKIGLFYITLTLTVILAIFYLLGLYTEDLLNIFTILCILNIFILNRQQDPPEIKQKIIKIQSILLTLLNRFFQNPWKMGFASFLILFFSYGFKIRIDDGFGYDTGVFLQALSYPFYKGHYLYTTLNNDAFSFLSVHFEPYLFLLNFIKYLPYPHIWLYAVAYTALSMTFVFGIKILKDDPNLSLFIKSIIILSCASFYFWNGLALFEFHELALAPLFYLLIYRAWQKKSYFQLIIFTLLALCIKETIFITFIYCGILLLFSSTYPTRLQPKLQQGIEPLRANAKNFTRNTGLILLIAGSIFYLMYFKFILPSLRSSTESIYLRYYSHLGNSALEILFSPFIKPTVFFSSLFKIHNLSYFTYIFLPLIPFLRKGWKFILLATPTIIISAISLKYGYTNPKAQYGGELVIPMCLVVYYGSLHLQEKLEKNRFPDWQKRFTLALSLACFLYFLNANPVRNIKKQFRVPEEIAFAYQLTKIPHDKVVYTNAAPVLPFIASRTGLIYDDADPFIGLSKINLPIDYVIFKGDINQINANRVKKDHLQLIRKSNDYYFYKVTK